ncbi:hypothetical protein LG200_07980 [Methylobacillus caricis]|uniref:hypothetical protein n=1 Tax=Methylobacillus caricis TaxID=1971611 RepID=UPI001CFFB729|nr:hypothetical protein [Methylobacillus caricis]MCB5187942.1 hypothetical protein [Methylobacillus caricis]
MQISRTAPLISNPLPTLLGLANLCPALALATGFVELPAEGFAVEDGTSAYTLCNSSGKFSPHGQADIPRSNIPLKPTPAVSNTCAVFPSNEITAPLEGYTLVTHAVRQAVMNNAYTAYKDKKIASVTEFVWRNQAQTECIYGTRVITLSSADADFNEQKKGRQYFRISDVARGGLSGLPVEAAYSLYSSTAEPVYRIGRTFTAVQYKNGQHYARQPRTSPAYQQAINGLADPGRNSAVPTAAQQSASLNDNWVNFTTVIGLPKRPASAMLYVKTACSAEAPVTLPDAIRLRQTTAPFIELSVPGFVPPGGKIEAGPVPTATTDSRDQTLQPF